MKNTINKLKNKTGTLVNGAMALAIVALIALGCTCNKNFDLANLGKESGDNRAISNTATDAARETDDTTTTPPATRADASKGAIPDDDELQYMAKTTLLDFNDALQKADFTSFHNNISKAWQKQISAEKFRQTFQDFIDKGVDISDINSEKASFSPAARIESVGRQKMLVVQGSYDISPAPTTFELKYIPEGKQWKLFGINVITKSFK